jgi:choloylglycine hydrolase
MIYRILSVLLSVLAIHAAEACTAFQLKAEDGTQIYCRTLEFGFKLDSDILIVPQGIEYTGTAPGAQPGLKWKTKYGFVGLNQTMAPTLVSDGMNEKGLVASVLYLPGFTQYEAFDAKKKGQTLGCWELPSYLLSTCATVQEVKAILPMLLIAEEPPPGMFKFLLPLHFYISDKSGAVVIVEFIKGERHVYDNPYGALTNSPPFDWHLNNLSNSINLSPVNAPDLKLSGGTVQNIGQGSGLLGLRGDYTSASRFVRATLFSQWAAAQKNESDLVNLGFHLLNSFDIADGIVVNRPDKNNQSHTDTTEWVIVHDRTHLKTYVRHYQSLHIQMVDFKKIDFTKGTLRMIPVDKVFSVDDVTANSQPLKSF